MSNTTAEIQPKVWNSVQVVSSIMAILAGYIGAAAFIHTSGFFVTFMTGNAERSVLYFFVNKPQLAFGAITLTISFFLGVFVASIFRRRFWKNHPHGAALITAFAMAIATIITFVYDADYSPQGTQYLFLDICFVAFGTGALNASFTKNGETSIPITYHTGSVVKLAQGMEKHFSGGSYKDWISYAIMYFSFVLGALIGGLVSLIVAADYMLALATIFSIIVAGVAYKVDATPKEL